MINKNKQYGTAILLALFVTALASSIAVTLSLKLHTTIAHTSLLINQVQLNLYSDGAKFWAIETLTNNWKNQQANKLIDKTPIISPIDKINGATISTEIQDLQDKININNLTDSSYQKVFSNLIQQLDPSITQNIAQDITHAIFDWISKADKPTELDKFYAKQTPAYSASHQPMQSISELRMIKGINRNLFNKLKPFIAALPQNNIKINVNTVSPKVLIALNPDLTDEKINKFIQQRKNTPITSLQQLKTLKLVLNSEKQQNKLSFYSQYFLVKSIIKKGRQNQTTYTILFRDTQKTKPILDCIWHSFETL